MARRALLLALVDPAGNPRPHRMIELLKAEGFIIDALTDVSSHPMGFEHHVEITRSHRRSFRFLRRSRNFLLRLVRRSINQESVLDYVNNLICGVRGLGKRFAETEYDVVIVEDLFLLPTASKVVGGGRLIFDAREFYPKQNEDSVMFRFFEKNERTRLCRRYLPLCDLIFTVSPGILDAYRNDFGVEAKLLRSAPQYIDLDINLREDDRIRMVHHGLANRNRNLGQMIRTMEILDDRFSLDFFLVGDQKEINFLKVLAGDNCKISFRKPVAFDELLGTLVEYDLGFYYLEPSGFNVEYSLPNKFFEFIQARLGVAVGPSPEMAALVKEYGLGVVAEQFSPESMAQALSSITAESLGQFKSNSHLAASELCFEMESRFLVEYLRGL